MEPIHEETGQDYYDRVAALNAVPLWRLAASTQNEPPVLEHPHVWRWREVYPELERAADVVHVGSEEADRRVLTFKNPGLPPMAVGATQTLTASLQLLMPGESAPPHRHTYSALRFIIDGEGGHTDVDGERIEMKRGDLLLTPNSVWHSHGHEGAAQPVVWLDGLDFPFTFYLRSAFFQDDPSDATSPMSAHPPVDLHSPQRVYPWAESFAALRNRQAVCEDDVDGTLLEYTNPVTGGHVLPTIACYLQALRPGATTRLRRQTTSAVCFVVSGSGALVLGDRRLEWETNDVFSVPAWAWHQLVAADGEEVVLFRMSDLPMQEPFGLYHNEVAANESSPTLSTVGASERSR